MYFLLRVKESFMGKKKQNNRSNKPATTNKEPQPKKFQPKDLLCVLAAVIFVGLWAAEQYGVAISQTMAGVGYGIIILLLALYLLTGEKFRSAWRQWDIHKKIFFFILIIADVIAVITYDVLGNPLRLLILAAANYLYYLLFLRIKNTEESNSKKSKKYL